MVRLFQPPRGVRNNRRWYEDGDLCVLNKGGKPTLVSIKGMGGDTPEGEVIYYVVEVLAKLCYPASSRNLRAVKDRAEVDSFLSQPKEPDADAHSDDRPA